MNRNRLMINIAAAAIAAMWFAAQANATLICPNGDVYPQYGPDQTHLCPTTPDPVSPGDVTNTNTNTNTANANADANASATGGDASVGDVTATGGRGGRGGDGGSSFAGANAHGGVQGQQQRQRQRVQQSARTGDVNNTVKHEAAAASAIAPNIAGCGGTPGGGFSAAIQVLGWGASASRCKGDRFEQVIRAEDRAAQGKTAGMGYLVQVDKSSRQAFGPNVVDIRDEVIATAASAACQVVSRHSNGNPKEVRAYPRPGRTKQEALESCLSVRKLFLVQ